MKKYRLYSLVLVASIIALLTACADLAVRELSYSPTCPTTKTEIVFTAQVENIGTDRAGPNKLAFKIGGETIPETFDIPALEPGETYTVQRTILLDVAQRYQNTVTVDVDDDVSESSEDNNEAKLFYTVDPVPDTTGLTNFEYNEGLATVLRGVSIDDTAAHMLNVSPGYYRIREFRVWTQPDERAKVLCIEKNYAEYATGESNLPTRDEPWVFTIIEEKDWSPYRRAFSAKDYYGHSFTYVIEFDLESDCWNVLTATLDCAKIELSTQTYTTSVLNTCGWSSEPPWTSP